MTRIGLLGGTFDPFHNGHLDIGAAAMATLGLSELIVVVSNIPPHRPQPVASSHHRFAMVALAIAGRANWRASDLELAAGGPSFTTDTLRHFADAGYQANDLFFVIGADAFADIETWKDYPHVLGQSNFAVVSRPGFPVHALGHRLPHLKARMRADATVAERPSLFLIDSPTADVSATAIRRRLAAGESIAGLVPPGVQQHIEQHRLYSTEPMPARLANGGSRREPITAAGRLHGQDR